MSKKITMKLLFICLILVAATDCNAQNVGIGTTTPKAAFNVAENKTVLFGLDSNGAGSKMIWYPGKSAFRVGLIPFAYDYWDYNNVGLGSFASGIGTKASGAYSTAMGSYSEASGLYSIAMGWSSVASGDYSTAMGWSSLASGHVSTAMGGFSVASGTGSTAMGLNTIAKSFAETSIGLHNTDYTALSTTSWNAADRLFVIGNGTDLNASSDAMVVLKSGNTGFGTSTPSEKLEVAGKIKTTSLQLTTGAANGKILTSDASGNASWATPVVPANYWTVAGNNIYNNNTGNVGIGISSPNGALQFATSNQKRKIVLFETANNDNQFFGFGVFAGELRYQTGVASDDHVFYTAASSSSSNELMRIKGNGNVGIGTAAPNAALQFSNNTANRKIVLYEGANNDHQFNGFGLNPGVLRYQVNNSNDDHVFYAGTSTTTSNELMRIKGNGKVGIGTNNPTTAKLVINGIPTEEGLDLSSADQYANMRVIRNSLNSFDKDLYLGFQSGAVSALHLYSNNIETMTIKGGNAGIGTATPVSKLEVNGALATKATYYGSGSGNVALDNSATVWIFAINGFSVSLPDPAASANRRYTIVNKTNAAMVCSSFYNMANALTTSIPAFSSIEVIASNNTNRWEQIK
jgi:hypothetical protein